MIDWDKVREQYDKDPRLEQPRYSVDWISDDEWAVIQELVEAQLAEKALFKGDLISLGPERTRPDPKTRP